jgi:methyl-accepting chemotaxis protein
MPSSSTSIDSIATICRQAANGDLEARVSTQSDDPAVVRLAGAINHLLDIADAYVRETSAAMEHCARGEFHRPILLRGLNGAYRDSARKINQAALAMKTSAETIARFESERAAVARRVKATTESVNGSATQMRETSSAIGTHVASIRGLASDVAAATNQAAQNSAAVAAACHELTTCTSEITRRTGESSQLTRNAVNESTRARAAIQDLGEAARKIGSVVDVIGKIARQTNLLALNATIEAARAGEHGRSFAVVATEVKSLSRETAQATEKIASQVEAMRGATAHVATVITGVGDSINRIDATAAAIAHSIQEQAAATNEIAQRITEVSQTTSDISARMGEVNAASSGLEEITGGLQTAAETLATDARTLREQTVALAPDRDVSAPADRLAAQAA